MSCRFTCSHPAQILTLMKSSKQEAVVNAYEMLLERFGEPIGSYSGTMTGARDERPQHCDHCGGMLPMEGSTCDACGIDEADYENYNIGFDKDKETIENVDEGKALVNRPTKDKKGPSEEMKLDLESDDVLAQKAPSGGEKVVRSLKKAKGVKNPFAVAWAMKNKGEI